MFFQLAGDKEDRDAKLKKMTDELRKLKDKLGMQERLEDEVYILFTYIAVTCWFLICSFDSLIVVRQLGYRVARQLELTALYTDCTLISGELSFPVYNKFLQLTPHSFLSLALFD